MAEPPRRRPFVFENKRKNLVRPWRKYAKGDLTALITIQAIAVFFCIEMCAFCYAQDSIRRGQQVFLKEFITGYPIRRWKSLANWDGIYKVKHHCFTNTCALRKWKFSLFGYYFKRFVFENVYFYIAHHVRVSECIPEITKTRVYLSDTLMNACLSWFHYYECIYF